LPLKLVQANIALFKGERAELLRLLEEYRAQSGRGSHDPYYTLLLWLEAQAQNDQDARLEQLRALVALEREDIYTSLAREILHDEETYSAKLAQVERGRRRAIRLTLLLGAAGVILLIVVLALGLLSGN